MVGLLPSRHAVGTPPVCSALVNNPVDIDTQNPAIISSCLLSITLHSQARKQPYVPVTSLAHCADQRAFVVTLARAGEDNKSFRLTDLDSTLSGFAGADYDLQVGVGVHVCVCVCVCVCVVCGCGLTLNQSRKETVALQGEAAAAYANYCTWWWWWCVCVCVCGGVCVWGGGVITSPS